MGTIDCIGIAKDRFEEKGIELQKTAKNIEQVTERLDQSCIRCSLYHRQSDCDTCPIRLAMIGNVKFRGFPTKDYLWVQDEIKELAH